MFFKQIKRNAARNRKGNGLLYGSLVIAIVAFYTLLSLDKQDVMQFLSTIESEAVKKLLSLIPAVYAVSLFFVFFLVYFACRYQMESRRKEFGLYLMLGMKRSRLFFMLLGETLWNSIVSLLAGIPAAILLTEGTSLVTAKIAGLGIIGHSFSLSPEAILLTICGFIIIQVISLFVICLPYGRTEPAKFMQRDAASGQLRSSKPVSAVFTALGIVFLLVSYYIGLFDLSHEDISALAAHFALMLLTCALGTFSVYRGMGGIIGVSVARKARSATGLGTFTGRQVQESVLHQHRSLAVSSLLFLIALTCISYGIAMGAARITDSRTTDFSLTGTEQKVSAVLADPDVKAVTAASYPVYLSMTNIDFDTSRIQKALGKLKDAENASEYFHADYIISLSSYNRLMSAMGKESLTLGSNEAALYSTMESSTLYTYFSDVLAQGMTIGINGTDYRLKNVLYTDKIVADRSITLYAALIVSDDLYAKLAQDTEPFCWNLHLNNEFTQKYGLLQAIQKTEKYIDKYNIEYDSFLGGIGRTLFYTVAISYLTIYLGVIFLLIANTAVGTKFLIQQRENRHRYVTLMMLGADKEEMCRSARKQINTFFGLVLSVAVFNSIMFILILFSNFSIIPPGGLLTTIIILSLAALLLFVLTEIIYLAAVKRNACREIRAMDITDRG